MLEKIEKIEKNIEKKIADYMGQLANKKNNLDNFLSLKKEAEETKQVSSNYKRLKMKKNIIKYVILCTIVVAPIVAFLNINSLVTYFDSAKKILIWMKIFASSIAISTIPATAYHCFKVKKFEIENKYKLLSSNNNDDLRLDLINLEIEELTNELKVLDALINNRVSELNGIKTIKKYLTNDQLLQDEYSLENISSSEIENERSIQLIKKYKGGNL